DRLIEQATGIVAQIDDKALELVPGLSREVCDCLLETIRGLLVELGDANEADIVAFNARTHRAHADDIAGDRYFDRLVLPLAHDLELDLGVDGPAHLLDRLIERESLHRLIIEMRDDVIRHDAG